MTQFCQAVFKIFNFVKKLKLKTWPEIKFSYGKHTQYSEYVYFTYEIVLCGVWIIDHYSESRSHEPIGPGLHVYTVNNISLTPKAYQPLLPFELSH